MTDPQSPDSAAIPDKERSAEARGKRSALYSILASRGEQPTSQQKALLDACDDLGQLDSWIAAALAGQKTSQFLSSPAPAPAPTARPSKALARLRIAALAAACFALLLFAAALVIVLTGDRAHLTQGSERLVGRLNAALEIEVYASQSTPQVKRFVRDLSELLALYEKAGKGNVHVRVVDVVTEEQRTQAKQAGLQEFVVGAGEESADTATVSRAYLGVVFSYKGEKETIPILAPNTTQGLEFWLSNKIREIQCKGDKSFIRIGVVQGKNEISLKERNLIPSPSSPALASVMRQALPHYRFEEVDLEGGRKEIDAALQGLLITQPGAPFSEAELRRIDQFVMRGKGLTILASAVQVPTKAADMPANLGWNGLDKLITGYGIEPANEGLSDPDHALRLPVQEASGRTTYVRSATVLVLPSQKTNAEGKPLLDTAFAGFFRLDDVAFPLPSRLTPRPEKQPTAQLRIVARTGDNTQSWTAEGTKLGLNAPIPTGVPVSSVPIAIAVTGTLRSATAGLSGSETIAVPSQSAPGARVLVIASGQFLANPFARALGVSTEGTPLASSVWPEADPALVAVGQAYAQKNLTQTILAFKNTLDWMVGDEDLVEASRLLIREPETSTIGKLRRWWKR